MLAATNRIKEVKVADMEEDDFEVPASYYEPEFDLSVGNYNYQ